MSFLESVRARFDPLPHWIEVLATACDRSTQKAVGRRISYSTAVISNVLKGSYTGDLKAVEAAVKDGLMRGTVACPVLGEINGAECRKHQLAPFAATSTQRVQVYRACRNGCPNSRLENQDAEA